MGKTLIAYYSRRGENYVNGSIKNLAKGNTEVVAAKIKDLLPDADVYQIDTIILGYPNWWGTMPMVCYTFLEAYDFTGKRIIPFCTNEGSGMGSSVRFINKLCPTATVLNGTPIHGAEAASADREALQIVNMAKQ